ncbi:MAG: hypothetical protein RIB67_03610 [Miltoncostaeaceae bacterium]
MLGRTAVTGLGALVLLGGGAVGAVAAGHAAEGETPLGTVDMRKTDDEPRLIMVEDDDARGDGDGDLDQLTNSVSAATGSAPSATAPSVSAPGAPGAGDTTAGDTTASNDGTAGGDTTTDNTSTGGNAAAGVTPRDLLIDQRIAQAALRRLAVVEALRAGRPAPAASTNRSEGRRVSVSAAQLRINQRISAAAVRRANRLAGRPTPAPSGQPAPVRLTKAQVQINQRISQAAVRRANELLAAERAKR